MDAQQGQLGHNHDKTLLRPCRVEALEGVRCIEISAGGIHSGAVDVGGTVYTWGDGRYACSPSNTVSTDQLSIHNISYGQLGQGEGVVGKGAMLLPGQVIIEAGGGMCVPFKAVKLSCGGMHTAAIVNDGSVWCWGRADSGQTGT
jgi:alpha-tubulin suppressor-like RCC1 family protein